MLYLCFCYTIESYVIRVNTIDQSVCVYTDCFLLEKMNALNLRDLSAHNQSTWGIPVSDSKTFFLTNTKT